MAEQQGTMRPKQSHEMEPKVVKSAGRHADATEETCSAPSEVAPCTSRGAVQLRNISSLDLAWDVITVMSFLVDTCFNVGVAWMLYSRGFMRSFYAACAIFAVAHLSYALVFVSVCGGDRRTLKQRVATLGLVLPFAQLVPIILWLRTFNLPWLDQLMARFEPALARGPDAEGEGDRFLSYIRVKCRSHLGFIFEAFLQAAPQCLLKTAALCMYPELATSFSICSILVSIFVVLSKAYLLSYSPLLPLLLLNAACICADLLGAFAAWTWLVAAPGVGEPFLVHCLLQVVYHGVFILGAGMLLLLVLVYLTELRSDGIFIPSSGEIFVGGLITTFLVAPLVCLLLSVLKFGLIPLISGLWWFEAALLELLPPHLPRQEVQRRTRIVNLFSLFAELQGLSSGSALDDDFACRTRKNLHGLTYCWKDWKPTPDFLRDASHERTQEASTSQMIESLFSGVMEVQTAYSPTCGALGKLLGSLQSSLRLSAERLRRESQMWLRERSPSLLLRIIVDTLRQARTDGNQRLDIGIVVVKLSLLMVGLRHGPFFAWYAILYVSYGILFPVTELLRYGTFEYGYLQMAGLPVLLSCGYCLCLAFIGAFLYCVCVLRSQRRGIFIWQTRKVALPEGFKDPQVVAAIVRTCEEQAMQTERALLLHQAGLPLAAASKVVGFMDPSI